MPELKDFEGVWHLSRVIEDRRAHQRLRLEGQAVFRPDAEGLIYEETGHLHLPGHAPVTATRRYLWRAAKAGIAVFFEDGRFFHDIADVLRPEAHHACAPDSYAVTYDFAAWPCWSSRWHVTGPRKDYAMRSDFARPG